VPGTKPNDQPKHPFKAGLPAAAIKHEPKRFPCVGKLTNERQVNYGR
jgi:hypothetical protein